MTDVQLSPRLCELLSRQQTRIAVLTGAGVSAESGVPTFRDPDGLWQKFKPEELASMDAFLRNPELVQSWYEHRRKVVREVSVNAGHTALAELQRRFSSFTLITQNVDGLHSRAGSVDVLEVHGNILRSLCVDCGELASGEQLDSGGFNCKSCGGLLRPDVVWFGEMLPSDVWEAAERAAVECDLFFTVGTSAAVYPAAGLPLLAGDNGAYVVEINPSRTAISGVVDEVLCGPSAVVLPEVFKQVDEAGP